MDWKKKLQQKPRLAKKAKTKHLDIAGFWHEETKRFLQYEELLKLPKEDVVDWKGKPKGWRVVTREEFWNEEDKTKFKGTKLTREEVVERDNELRIERQAELEKELSTPQEQRT